MLILLLTLDLMLIFMFVPFLFKLGEFVVDLSSANKFQIVGSGNLVLSSVQKSDAGWYICSARNLAGTRDTNPTEITINGRYTVNDIYNEWAE